MQTLIIVIIGGSATILTISALLLVLRVFFLGPIERSVEQVTSQPRRSFLLGLVNTIFLAGIFTLFAALSENALPGLFLLPALLSALFFTVGTLLGFSGLALIVTQRLFPNSDNFSAQLRGALILLLAISMPYVGWFLLLPYLLFTGFGGFLSSLFQQYQNRNSGGK